MEVDSWAQFSQWFTHLIANERPADPMAVLTVILSDATNIGLTKMAEATPEYSYYRLSSTADWYVREENYAKALAESSRSSIRCRSQPTGAREPLLLPTVRPSRFPAVAPCWPTPTPSMAVTQW